MLSRFSLRLCSVSLRLWSTEGQQCFNLSKFKELDTKFEEPETKFKELETKFMELETKFKELELELHN